MRKLDWKIKCNASFPERKLFKGKYLLASYFVNVSGDNSWRNTEIFILTYLDETMNNSGLTLGQH
jgi:hypothetical protein